MTIRIYSSIDLSIYLFTNLFIYLFIHLLNHSFIANECIHNALHRCDPNHKIYHCKDLACFSSGSACL